MAYLKGGTVVDGNLYVEGSLRIKSVEDIEGNQFTYISDIEGRDKRIPVFTGTHALMKDSYIEQNSEQNSGETTLIYTIKDTDANESHLPFTIGNDVSTFTVDYSTSLKGKKSSESSYADIASGDAPELVQYWSYI